MVVKRFLTALSVALAMLPAASSAFDGNRKGLVLGGGVGVSPVARWSTEGIGESMVGLGMHIVAGYAWDEHNVIVYEGNLTFFSSDYYNSTSLFGSSSLLSAQGIDAASWYHYAGPAGRSFFTVVGLGLCVFDRGEAYHSDSGGGYLLGGGYEFARHFQVGLYFSGGRTFDAGHDFAHRHLSLLVSGFVF